MTAPVPAEKPAELRRCHRVTDPSHQPHDWSSSYRQQWWCPGAGSDAEWYGRTGHCGACGQPGSYCLCRIPCGCSQLHQCGSGLEADPAVVFAAPDDHDQQELFQ